jgi:hypothetical protein
LGPGKRDYGALMAVDLHPIGIHRSAYKTVYAPAVIQQIRSPLQVQMRGDLTNVFFNTAEFGGTCQYQHFGSSVTKQYPYILDTPSDELAFGQPRNVVSTRPCIQIPLHHMSQYPMVRDRVIIDGISYTVSTPPSDDGVGVVTIDLQRSGGARL